jgi:cytochrome c oxidase subunit IV
MIRYSPEPAHAGHHIVPVRVYLLIFAALLVGTLATVWISYYNLDVQIMGKTVPFNTVVMFLIAATKGTLVVLFFMHVKYSPRLLWIFVAAGFMWLSILMILTMADYASRNW